MVLGVDIEEDPFTLIIIKDQTVFIFNNVKMLASGDNPESYLIHTIKEIQWVSKSNISAMIKIKQPDFESDFFCDFIKGRDILAI